MNTSLYDMNINDIVPGLEVIGPIGTFGKVQEVIKENDNIKKEMNQRVRYDTIKIVWDSGRTSTVFHMQTNEITLRNQIN